MDKEILVDIKKEFDELMSLNEYIPYIVIGILAFFVLLVLLIIIKSFTNKNQNKQKYHVLKLQTPSKDNKIYYYTTDKTVRANEYVLINPDEVGIVSEVYDLTKKEINKICKTNLLKIIKAIDKNEYDSIFTGKKVLDEKDLFTVLKLRYPSKSGNIYYLTMNKNIKKFDHVLVSENDAGEVSEIYSSITKEEVIEMCGEIPPRILKIMTRDEYNIYYQKEYLR